MEHPPAVQLLLMLAKKIQYGNHGLCTLQTDLQEIVDILKYEFVAYASL